MPLYLAACPLKEQRRCIAAITERAAPGQDVPLKWSSATNIAETSVTIPDIDVVIDKRGLVSDHRALLSALWYVHS